MLAALSAAGAEFLGRSELIRNKPAVGRTRDLADLEALGEVDRSAPSEP